LIIALVSGQF